MNMEKKEFLRILEKYQKGQASAEEEKFLHAYYNLFDSGEHILHGFNSSAKEDLKNSIRSEIRSRIETGEPTSRIRWNYFRITAAAAAVLILGSFIYYFYSGLTLTGKQEPKVAVHKQHDIAPGSNKAVLTLANGSTIVLDNAKNGVLAKQGSAEIHKTADGKVIIEALRSGYNEQQSIASTQLNTISTPRGGQYQLTLPDGSEVWLNSASSIRFPTAFKGNERKVEITGEAYFEITKNKSKPFLVVSARQTVEVLGTHFNVNAYEDEDGTKTTLLEGSVRVSPGAGGSKDQSRSVTIKPGEQARLKGQALLVVNADPEGAVAWKNGYFKFDRENVQSVMRQISRWYDVDVEYRGKIPEDELVGKIKRTVSVSGVLRILELGNVNCWVEGRKIIVKN